MMQGPYRLSDLYYEYTAAVTCCFYVGYVLYAIILGGRWMLYGDTDRGELKRSGMISFGLVVAGAVVARCGFPSVSFHPATFAGWALFLEGLRLSRRPFWSGIMFSMFFLMALCSWIPETLLSEFMLSLPLALAFFLLVVCVLPSFAYGVFSVWVYRVVVQAADEPTLKNGLLSSLFISSSFVVVEWARVTFSPEHGWGQVGTIFYNVPEILMVAGWTGGPGLAFLVVICSSFIWLFFHCVRRGRFATGAIYLILSVLMLSSVYVAGALILPPVSDGGGQVDIEVAVIHSGIPQSKRWKKRYHPENRLIYEELSQKAFSSGDGAEKTRLVIWPETALATYDIQTGGELADMVRKIGERTGAWFLAGMPSYEKSGAGTRFFNSAFLISPDGRIENRYDKKYLLPFAERKITFFKLPSEKQQRAYSPGRKDETVLLPAGPFANDPVRIGLAICYETAIPSHVHAASAKGMQLLVNLSNDAWFKESSESRQQLSMLALRCAEFGVPGIRSTGYGVAAIIDRYGRIVQETAISGQTVLHADINIPDTPQTLNRRFKDWFVIVSILVMLATLRALPLQTVQ